MLRDLSFEIAAGVHHGLLQIGRQTVVEALAHHRHVGNVGVLDQRDVLGDVVELERRQDHDGAADAVELTALQRGNDVAHVHRDAGTAELVDDGAFDIGRQHANLLALEVGEGANRLDRRVGGGPVVEDRDADHPLVFRLPHERFTEVGAAQSAGNVRDIVEQTRNVRNLKTRVDSLEEARRQHADLDRADLHAVDHFGHVAELAAGEQLDVDTAVGHLFEALLVLASELVVDFVGGEDRDLDHEFGRRRMLGSQRNQRGARRNDEDPGHTKYCSADS